MTTEEGKQKKFIRDAINKQLMLAKHKVRYEDVEKLEDWYTKYTMTKKQHDKWKEWFLVQFKKDFGRSVRFADREFLWFDLMWGLKISDEQ